MRRAALSFVIGKRRKKGIRSGDSEGENRERRTAEGREDELTSPKRKNRTGCPFRFLRFVPRGFVIYNSVNICYKSRLKKNKPTRR